MKTQLILATLILFANTILSGENLEASKKNDTLAINTKVLPIPPVENYIDDIPFNTELIANNSILKLAASTSVENYINDIPFNTEVVVALHNYNKIYIHPEEEGYVDDIPFDTSKVAAHLTNYGCGFALEKDNKCGD